MTRGGHLDAPWYCMKSDVRGKTLLDIARENGLTTCSLSWPVSGGADYTMNMPMIVPYSYQGYQPQKWLEHTATANLMDRYFYKHGRYLMGPTRSLDLFTMALALDILEDGPQPDIMLIKLCDLDSARHTYGVESAEAETQLRMHDEQLGAILEYLRRKGTLDETNIIVLGDHGQTDIRDAFLMNVYFRRLGLLTVDADGKIASFDAVCHSTGLAALIEVRDPDDAALMARVREALEALRHDPDVQLSMVLDAARGAGALRPVRPVRLCRGEQPSHCVRRIPSRRHALAQLSAGRQEDRRGDSRRQPGPRGGHNILRRRTGCAARHGARQPLHGRRSAHHGRHARADDARCRRRTHF